MHTDKSLSSARSSSRVCARRQLHNMAKLIQDTGSQDNLSSENKKDRLELLLTAAKKKSTFMEEQTILAPLRIIEDNHGDLHEDSFPSSRLEEVKDDDPLLSFFDETPNPKEMRLL